MSQEKLAVIIVCAVILAMIWLISFVFHIIPEKHLMSWYSLAIILTILAVSVFGAIVLGIEFGIIVMR